MNPVWFTGFEHGVATLTANGGGLCDAVSGTISISSSYTHNDRYSLKANPTAGTCYFSKTISTNKLVIRVYIYFVTKPNGANSFLVAGYNSGSTYPVLYYSNVTDKLYVGYNGIDFSQASSMTINTGQWYCVDLSFDTSTTDAFTINWTIDGTAQTQALATAGATAFTMTALRLGCPTNNVTAEVYFDDVITSYTSADYPLTITGIEGLSPSTDGTHVSATQIQKADSSNITSATTDAHDSVNTVPIGDSALYIKQVTTGSYYAEVKVSASQTNILGATALLAYRAATATTDKAAFYVIDEDAVLTTIWGNPTTTADFSESSVFYKNQILPVTAGGWDEGAINALKFRFGKSDDINPVPWFVDMMLEVAYATSGAPVLTLQNATQAQTAGIVALTQHYILATVNNATQAQTAGIVALTQHYILATVNNATQAQTSEKPTLSYHDASTALAVASTTHLQTSEKVALSAHYALSSVKDATQLQTAGGVVLTAHYAIVTKDTSQAQTADNITLTNHPKYTLTVGNASQNQTSDNLTITYVPMGTVSLTIQNSSQTQTAGNTTLTQHQLLAVNNTSQLQTGVSVSLTQHQILAVDNTAQAQTASMLTLIVAVTAFTLAVQNATQLQYSDNLYIGLPVYPPDVFVGDITHSTVTVTRATTQTISSTVVKTPAQIQRVNPVITKDRAY